METLLKNLDCEDNQERIKDHNATIEELMALSHKEWCKLVPEQSFRTKLELRFPNAGVSSADTASIITSEGESSFNRTQSSINEQ